MRLVVVGATGAVGTEILDVIGTRESLQGVEVVAVASSRSAGRKLPFRGRSLEVAELTAEIFAAGDLALFDVPDDVAREWAPVAAERGAVIVDNSAAWRMHGRVPLVVPEVNPEAARDRPLNIVASPNCTMLAMVVPVAALHRAFGLTSLIASSYQAASGAGKAGVDELWDQTERVAKEPDLVTRGLAREVLEAGNTFAHPLAMNVIPQIGSVRDSGFTGEELKVGDETRKVLGLPELPVTMTCVRVPTMVGHGVSIHAQFREGVTAETARAVLEDAIGVEVVDDPGAGFYPTPQMAAGRDPCFVGRIRGNLHDPKAVDLFSVADNLRKGAALNTVQIAELLLAD